jgi:hypothetical protein
MSSLSFMADHCVNDAICALVDCNRQGKHALARTKRVNDVLSTPSRAGGAISQLHGRVKDPTSRGTSMPGGGSRQRNIVRFSCLEIMRNCLLRACDHAIQASAFAMPVAAPGVAAWSAQFGYKLHVCDILGRLI